MLGKAALVALTGTLAVTPLAAQDVDDVLKRYYAAVGGVDAWNSVQSRRATGSMSMGPGMEASFTRVFKRPDKICVEFTFQGMTAVQAYDGQTAWMLMPFMGSTDPQVMPEGLAKDLVEQADFDGPLIGFEGSGQTVELVGKEQVDGTEAFKLKIIMSTGEVIHYYIDSDNYLPIKLTGTGNFQGTESEFEAVMSDYREVGGLVISHLTNIVVQGMPVEQVITLDLIEVNVDVPDDLFVMPVKE